MQLATEAIAILHAEPGWHLISTIAQDLGTATRTLERALKAWANAAADRGHSSHLLFGHEVDPEHPKTHRVVRLAGSLDKHFYGHVLPPSRIDWLRRLLAIEQARDSAQMADERDELERLAQRIRRELGVPDMDAIFDDRPPDLAVVQDAVDRRAWIEFDYQPNTIERTIRSHRGVPVEAKTVSDGWIFLLVREPLHSVKEFTYRFERVIGRIRSVTSLATLADPIDREPYVDKAIPVMVRIRSNDLWAVEVHRPEIQSTSSDGTLIDVRIWLYPELGTRFARIAFLTSGNLQILDAEHQHELAHYRKQLDALIERYGANDTER